MKVSLLFLLFFAFAGISFNSAAQNTTGKEANIWYFGHKAGLDFNFTPPRALTNGLTTGVYGGYASVCDSNGNLLFYTSPDSILDRNHQKMPNSPVRGGGAGISTAVVVPWPSNPGKYLFFNTGTIVSHMGYSVID